MSSTVAACVARVRRPVTALAVAILLAACDGSGQSGGAFSFLTVNGFSTDPSSTTGTVNSSIDTGTTTTACVTLQNNPKNPTVAGPTGLNNVIIQSYSVTLNLATGSTLGPFTFGTSVLVPAGTQTDNGIADNRATFPVILVPAPIKQDPRVRPPNRLPIVSTAEVTFRGRDGRGSSVSTEGAVTVVFVTEANLEVVPDCSTGNTTTMQIRRR
jgi:hypothetical protein